MLPDLMKMRINTTSICFYLACYLYAEIDFVVHDTKWLGLGVLGLVRIICTCQQIAYHMYVKIVYYMHAKHVRIILYARQSPFLHRNSTPNRNRKSCH